MMKAKNTDQLRLYLKQSFDLRPTGFIAPIIGDKAAESEELWPIAFIALARAPTCDQLDS